MITLRVFILFLSSCCAKLLNLGGLDPNKKSRNSNKNIKITWKKFLLQRFITILVSITSFPPFLFFNNKCKKLFLGSFNDNYVILLKRSGEGRFEFSEIRLQTYLILTKLKCMKDELWVEVFDKKKTRNRTKLFHGDKLSQLVKKSLLLLLIMCFTEFLDKFSSYQFSNKCSCVSFSLHLSIKCLFKKN